MMSFMDRTVDGTTHDRTGYRPRARALGAGSVAAVVFAALCVAVAVGFFLYPTYPNYDSYYSLLWGREVLDGTKPVFEGFRVPTEHPLAIAVGAVLSLFGEPADRIWVGMCFACFLWLVWGMYQLGRVAFTPLIGALAALLLLTRLDFAFLAARGYIDVPYMALVVCAAVLEARRPRAGTPVLVLLALAGLLRPEAWLLSGLYWLWLAWRASWRARLGYAALVAAAPLIWFGLDFAVTGDPLFSLHYTSSSAEELGRQRTLSEIPAAVPEFFARLVKTPVAVAAVLGIGVAAWLAPRRMAVPLMLLVSGVGTFVLIGVGGLSVIERYLLVASLAVLLFAAVAAGGFGLLASGSRARRPWAITAGVLVLAGALWTATHLDLERLDGELRFRGDAHAALASVLAEPAVRRGLRCGRLTVPNHKLVPDSRWIADLPYARVRARADPATGPQRRGVWLVVTSRYAIFKHAWTNPADGAVIQLPPAGWPRVAVTDYYTAYARC
jgi:hypothetical protein